MARPVAARSALHVAGNPRGESPRKALPPGRSHVATFHLLRLEDESGVSGTGWVAEGAVFSNGWVVLIWPTGTPSLNFYESLEAVEAVHGHGGLTRIVFD
jgi:hypothetical protein